MPHSQQSPPVALSASLAAALPRIDRRKIGPIALALLAAVCVLAALRPRNVIVNGRQVRVSRGATAADCARAAGLSVVPGDLVDVRGAVLQPGAGQPPVFLRNGEACTATERIGAGDYLDVTPGQTTTEPIKETASLLPYEFRTTGQGGVVSMVSQPGIVGIRRVQRGVVSGLVNSVEISAAAPTVVYEGRPRDPGRRIALTFDDGPTPQYTPQILDILKRYDARATFFVLSEQVQRWPYLVRREVGEGHEIGIHTWSHENLTRLSAAAIEANLNRCEHTLRPLVGAPIRWVRPPYGALNATARQTIAAMGYGCALWSVDTNDWQRPGSSVVAARVLNGAHNGAIVLMHDGGGPRQGTVDAVQSIVPALQKAGYELVTLSQLTGKAPAFDGRMTITSSEGVWKVTLAPAGLQITVDGERVALAVQPIEIEGQLLLPVAPTVKMMGASYEWDQAAQIIRVNTLRGRIVLRLNSRRVEINGTQDIMHVPPVLYRGEPMIPLWALVNFCGGAAQLDARTMILDIDTPFRGTSATEPPRRWTYIPQGYGFAPASWVEECGGSNAEQ